MYSQGQLTDAITEARSLNRMIEISKMHMRRLQENLEERTMALFIPRDIQLAREEELADFEEAQRNNIEKRSAKTVL